MSDFKNKPPDIGAPSLGMVPPVKKQDEPVPKKKQDDEQHEEGDDAGDQEPA
jgi:hypothetical protein